MTTPSPELASIPAISAQDLVNDFLQLTESYQEEDILQITIRIKDALNKTNPESTKLLFNDLLALKNEYQTQLRSPIIESVGIISESGQRTWENRPWENVDDNAIEGSRCFYNQIKPILDEHSENIIKSLNPNNPTWQKASAIDQAIGAVATKL